MTQQLKKEQLKKIILKEYIDVLKEVKNNKNIDFDKLAYEQVIQLLVKEGILDEQLGAENFISSMNPWSSANKMRRGVRAAEEEEELQSGESWGDARSRLGYSGETQSGVAPEGEAPYSEEPASGWADEDAAQQFQDEAAGLPPQYQQELVRLTQSAPAEFRNNIKSVGDEVYASLQNEVGSMKSPEQLAQLVLQIVGTVVNAMGSAGGRKWTTQDDESLAAKAGIGNEQSELEKLLAADPKEMYPDDPMYDAFRNVAE